MGVLSMFQNYSRAGIGMYTFIVTAFLRAFDIEVTDTQVEEVVLAVINIVAFIVWVWGQIERDDVEFGLIRKMPRK